MARNNQRDSLGNYLPVAAAVAGAAVGAVAGYLLSNEDNRKVVVKAARGVREQGMKRLEEGRSIAHQLRRGSAMENNGKSSQSKGRKSRRSRSKSK